MPSVPFHFYGLILIVLPVVSQFILYHLAADYFGSIGAGSRFTKLYLPVIIVIINIPLVLTRVAPRIFYGGFARHFIMVPFYAYQTMSVAILLVAFLWFIIKVMMKMTLRMSRRKKEKAIPFLPERRQLLKKTAIGLSGYAFIGSMYSIYNRDDFQVKNVSLQIRSLPDALSGLRIVMISDIHSGLYMTQENMAKYAEELNKLNGDLIFMPGDFVTSKTREVIPFVKSFSEVKSRHGIYACLGNHDYFADPNAITDRLRENGFTVLRNETTELSINGAKLMLSGVDDGQHADFKKVAFEANSLNTTKILLCHQPYYFDNAVAGGFDVMLSGHTHGGQIVLLDVLGLKLTPAALVSPYVSGKYYRGKSVMYVTRGIGTVGLPVRINCPPEITVFTLKKKG